MCLKQIPLENPEFKSQEISFVMNWHFVIKGNGFFFFFNKQNVSPLKALLFRQQESTPLVLEMALSQCAMGFRGGDHREKSELAKISITTSASLSHKAKLVIKSSHPYFSDCLLTAKDVFLLLFEYFNVRLAGFCNVAQIGASCLHGLLDLIRVGPYR